MTMFNRLAGPFARLLLLTCVLMLAGCNVLGAVLYKTAGEPDVEAQYTLPNVPTLVMAENFSQYDLGAADAELLARRVQSRLQEKLFDVKTKTAFPMVQSEKVLELRGRSATAFRKMTIPQIGKEVGAEQIIYIHFQGGGVASMAGGSTHQGKAAVLVKVVDVKTGATLWPTDMVDGRAVSFETSPHRGGDNQSDIRNRLYDGLSQQIARLFYKHKPGEEERY
jgi:hypothetical protein